MPDASNKAVFIQHLGESGLKFCHTSSPLHIDPPFPSSIPTLLTWSETERIAGARQSPDCVLAAHQTLLTWLKRSGTALGQHPVSFANWQIWALPYRPIPYATPQEALRKIGCALRAPHLAYQRLSQTVARPHSPPLAIGLEGFGYRIALLGQALHRFTTEAELLSLIQYFQDMDIVIAGSDYDDEAATGHLLGRFSAKQYIVADLIGPIRRKIGLPTRPLQTVLATAPPHTRALQECAFLQL